MKQDMKTVYVVSVHITNGMKLYLDFLRKKEASGFVKEVSRLPSVKKVIYTGSSISVFERKEDALEVFKAFIIIYGIILKYIPIILRILPK